VKWPKLWVTWRCALDCPLTLKLRRLRNKHCVKQKSLLEKIRCEQPTNPEPISKFQIGQRQVPEYQEVGMSFGLGDGVPKLQLVFESSLKLSSNFAEQASGIMN